MKPDFMFVARETVQASERRRMMGSSSPKAFRTNCIVNDYYLSKRSGTWAKPNYIMKILTYREQDTVIRLGGHITKIV
jgi:hypothetical protein